MKKKSTPSDPRSDEIVKKVKNNPFAAWIIAISIMVLAVLTFTTNFIETSGKLLQQIGIPTGAQARAKRKTAYELGKDMAFITEFETQKVKTKDPVPDDIQRMVGQRLAEINTYLTSLGISVDLKTLNFVSSLPYPLSSPAESFVRDQIESKVGRREADLYDLSRRIQGDYFFAARHGFANDETKGVNPIISLSALNSAAYHLLGCEEVKLQENGLNDDLLNTDIQGMMNQLDSRAEDKLNR
jgi:hypothetical protein